MDVKSKHTNELLLQNVVQEAPAHIVGLMGIHVMDVLAGELSAKDFADLLQDAEKYANDVVKVGTGGGNTPAEPEPQAAPEAASAPENTQPQQPEAQPAAAPPGPTQ
jgi:hypothetical protein